MTISRRVAITILVALCGAVTLSLAGYLLFRPAPQEADAEQYAVYSAYLQSGLTGESHDLGSAEGGVVLLGTAMNLRSCIGFMHVRAAFPQLSWMHFIQFLISNLNEKNLEPRFSISAKYDLATKEEIDTYPAEQFTRRFPRNYGYLKFSQVGFNHDLTEALFYTEHICGLCGAGRYVFMRKVKGQWVVESTSSTWVS